LLLLSARDRSIDSREIDRHQQEIGRSTAERSIDSKEIDQSTAERLIDSSKGNNKIIVSITYSSSISNGSNREINRQQQQDRSIASTAAAVSSDSISNKIDRSIQQQQRQDRSQRQQQQQQDPLNHQQCIGNIINIGLIDKQQRSIIIIITSTYFVIIIFGRRI
jgi:hypothetical protein